MQAKYSDDSDLLRRLYLLFLDGQPVPQQLADDFVAKYLKGRNGAVRSWDEVFGAPARYGTGKRIERQMEQGRLVAKEVDRLKAEGNSLNEEEFEAIGRRTAVGGKSKVKALLSDHRLWTGRVNELIQLGQGIFKNYRR